MPIGAILSLFLLVTTSSIAVSQEVENRELSHIKKSFEIIRYMRVKGAENMVVMEGGSQQGLRAGSIFTVFRSSKNTDVRRNAREESSVGQLNIEMGEIEAIKVEDSITIARIITNGGDIARAFFSRYPEIMAGDMAVLKDVNIVRKQMMLPTAIVAYRSLFSDPKASPASFELHQEGYEALRKIAMQFADKRLGLLMIEGHTDSRGGAQENQVESYQRAMTVRQFLVDEMGFEESRVVAVGYGEAEPIVETQVEGSFDANRRIVLRPIMQ